MIPRSYVGDDVAYPLPRKDFLPDRLQRYDCTISYGIHTMVFKKTMFLFCGIFKCSVGKMEVLSMITSTPLSITCLYASSLQNVYRRNIDIFLVFSFRPGCPLFRNTSQCNDCYAICRIQEVECCTRSSPN